MEQEKQESENTQPRKRYKFSHYILEFFMIVLAVTVGFFVDDYREYRSEREEEIDYMKSLLEDLEADRSSQQQIKENGVTLVMAGDSLLLQLTKSPLGNERKLYHYLILASSSSQPVYSDRTVTQLRSAGKFRIIKNPRVLQGLLNYDSEMRYVLNFTKEVWFQNRTSNYIELYENIFDIPMAFSRYDSVQKHIDNPASVKWPEDLKLVSYDKELLQRFRNSLFSLAEIDQGIVRHNNILLTQNRALDSLIRKEYFE